MSESMPSANAIGYGPIRTLAVRINDGTRLHLDILAQLNNRTVTDEIRLATEAWLDRSKTDPKVQQRAESVRQEIEAEAEAERSAISALFSAEADAPRSTPPSRARLVRLNRSRASSGGSDRLHDLIALRSPLEPVLYTNHRPSDANFAASGSSRQLGDEIAPAPIESSVRRRSGTTCAGRASAAASI